MFTRTLTAMTAATLMLGNAASAAPAGAGDVDEVSVSVRIGDLDLADEKGVARLHRRVRAAARQICGADEHREISMHVLTIECHERVLANASQDVQTAIAAARSPSDRLALRIR